MKGSSRTYLEARRRSSSWANHLPRCHVDPTKILTILWHYCCLRYPLIMPFCLNCCSSVGDQRQTEHSCPYEQVSTKKDLSWYQILNMANGAISKSWLYWCHPLYHSGAGTTFHISKLPCADIDWKVVAEQLYVCIKIDRLKLRAHGSRSSSKAK